MSANRHRLRHLAKRGSHAAITTLWLLDRTDQVLSLVLIANTLINALATALVTTIAITSFGREEGVLAITTGAVAFMLIVFAEISPKIIGATFPERIALPASLILKPLMAFSKPVIWFVNLFVTALLRLVRIRKETKRDHRLSPEELRSMVLEGGNFIPKKHQSILLNLFERLGVNRETLLVQNYRYAPL